MFYELPACHVHYMQVAYAPKQIQTRWDETRPDQTRQMQQKITHGIFIEQQDVKPKFDS